VIISVSLDDNKSSWLSAVRKYKKYFINVTDLNGFSNEIAIRYKVNSIPQNFLIDPLGRIIAIGIRGADIPAKLEETLK
jgi:hypothetical protein